MYCGLKPVKGFTLVELIISLSISFIIFGGLIQIYLSAQKNNLVQSDLNTIQESAQQALSLLENDIHNAGYIGSARLTEDFPISNHTNYSFTSSNKVTGDTKTITLRFMNPNTMALQDDMQDAANLIIPRTQDLHRGDVMMISDCQSAEIFAIASVRYLHDATVISSNSDLNKHFSKLAEIGRLEIKTYSIRNTGRLRESGSPIFALYSQLSGQHPNELVENIDAMNIHYEQTGIKIKLHLSANKLQKDWYGYANTL